MNKKVICIGLVGFIILGISQCSKINTFVNDYKENKRTQAIESKVTSHTASASEVYELAQSYLKDPKSLDKAITTFKMAIEMGSTPAMTALAHLYEKNNPSPQQAAEAYDLYKKAAEKNDSIGLYEVAIREEDPAKKEQLLTKSALQSYGPALILKSKRDLEHAHTDEDYLKILGMLTIVTQLGGSICPYPESFRILSMMYEKGLGVPKDPHLAKHYVSRAEYDEAYEFKE